MGRHCGVGFVNSAIGCVCGVVVAIDDVDGDNTIDDDEASGCGEDLFDSPAMTFLS